MSLLLGGALGILLSVTTGSCGAVQDVANKAAKNAGAGTPAFDLVYASGYEVGAVAGAQCASGHLPISGGCECYGDANYLVSSWPDYSSGAWYCSCSNELGAVAASTFCLHVAGQ